MQAVAIDKGLGWFGKEGYAEVKSEDVVFHTRPFQRSPQTQISMIAEMDHSIKPGPVYNYVP